MNNLLTKTLLGAVRTVAVTAGIICCSQGKAELIWNEVGDADEIVGQTIYGTESSLTTINGTLSLLGAFPAQTTDIDLYQFEIFDPTEFTARLFRTSSPGILDTYLYLFDSTGAGVVADNDSPTYPFLEPSSELPVGSVAAAGIYYLAVAAGTAPLAFDLPLDTKGDPIFSSLALSADFGANAASTVAPEIGSTTLSGWQRNATFPAFPYTGPYTVALTGARPIVPEPGAVPHLLWLAIATVGGYLRVRSRQQA